MYLDGIFDMWDWIKSFWVKKPPEPRVIEHRGMKGYFTSEMIEEFDNAGIDYEQMFREAVDEVIAEEEDEELDEENPYK